VTAKRTSTARTRRDRSTAALGAMDPLFAPVAAAFSGQRRVSRRRMFSSDSVLSVDGKIFAMLARGRFIAKLPRDRVDALVHAGTGERFDPGHGRLMKEWIAVPPRRADWVALAKEAYRYVRTGVAD
jgi:hypothetical protein